MRIVVIYLLQLSDSIGDIWIFPVQQAPKAPLQGHPLDSCRAIQVLLSLPCLSCFPCLPCLPRLPCLVLVVIVLQPPDMKIVGWLLEFLLEVATLLLLITKLLLLVQQDTELNVVETFLLYPAALGKEVSRSLVLATAMPITIANASANPITSELSNRLGVLLLEPDGSSLILQCLRPECRER